MDATPQPARLVWQQATVVATIVETPAVKTFRLKPQSWPGFTAGQHVDVRLTAPDGYQAQRSYSIASAPDESGTFDLTVELLEDGEVSPFFHEVVETGDTIEIRGPIGGHFVWRPGDGGPLLLIAGGSGLVPLMSILRHRSAMGPDVPTALVYSARHRADVIWADELVERARTDPGFHLFVTLSRETLAEPGFHAGRIAAPLIAEAIATLPMAPKTTFICGSTPFVGAAAELALAAGLPFASIRTERYGGA